MTRRKWHQDDSHSWRRHWNTAVEIHYRGWPSCIYTFPDSWILYHQTIGNVDPRMQCIRKSLQITHVKFYLVLALNSQYIFVTTKRYLNISLSVDSNYAWVVHLQATCQCMNFVNVTLLYQAFHNPYMKSPVFGTSSKLSNCVPRPCSQLLDSSCSFKQCFMVVTIKQFDAIADQITWSF